MACLGLEMKSRIIPSLLLNYKSLGSQAGAALGVGEEEGVTKLCAHLFSKRNKCNFIKQQKTVKLRVVPDMGSESLSPPQQRCR